MTFDPDSAAQALDSAETTGQSLIDLPEGLRPRSETDAYAIQDAVIRSAEGIAGWKITIDAKGAPSTCAPILGRRMVPNAAEMQIKPGLGIEVELALRFGRAPARVNGLFTATAIDESIASGHIAYEVLGSRFRDRKALPKLTTLADCQNNAAAVLGDGKDWRTLDLAAIELALDVDDQQVGTAGIDLSREQLCSALAWLAARVDARGVPLKAGDIVLTGARIGSIPMTQAGTVARATSPQLGEVVVTFI